ncbi:hypothetical protein RFI_34588, partial [Reticulomyxa filosa]
IKLLFNSDIHKYMGYPLELHEICSLLLYSEKSCNIQFCYDQIQFNHLKWYYLNIYLTNAIQILYKYERREENNIDLYCVLKGIKLDNIKKTIQTGYFITYINTFNNLQIAQIQKTNKQGCILHFHPSMRRSPTIYSCNISWISSYKYNQILFSRSSTNILNKKYSSQWNIKIENDNKYTQILLLTWKIYDQFIQQIIQISTIWNHSIDLNLIYIALTYCCGEDIYQTIVLLSEFEEWKRQDNKKEQKYNQEQIHQFIKRRCNNNNINLFCIFLSEKDILWKKLTAIEYAMLNTIHNGLPFVEKDKETWNKK